MTILIAICIVIPAVMFTVIFCGFVIAFIMDLVIARKHRNDLFYVLRKDFNDRRKPARK